MIIIGIIVAIFIFSLVIIIHEFGHFYAARRFGVKVEEFGLGIPPKAKELFTDKMGTKYTLNWLPLGGFVRLNGEESPHLTSPKGEELNKNKFYNKNYLEKSIILLAGVFMNFLLASVIFSVLFFIGIKPLGINDKIPTELNSKIIPTYEQALNDGILIKKEGEDIKVNRNFEYKYGALNSIKYGFSETYIQSVLTLKGLKILGKKIFSPEKPEDRQEALDQMSGPIGIVDFVSHSLGAGIIFLSIITAIISINLGIFNLLPIPALDGGRWFLLTLNTILKKIFGDKIKTENFENIIHVLFFITLIALSILIGYNDIIKIINR